MQRETKLVLINFSAAKTYTSCITLSRILTPPLSEKEEEDGAKEKEEEEEDVAKEEGKEKEEIQKDELKKETKE